ncbi:MAG TPA: NUDIX hydrolase [Flavobacteriales bacterium]|jgi:8-oxo-dGTP pyrophosphatase MutT (NUDIX family)|nr:NUDIX hydrolase [Flavobacteriales bacterium]
MARRYDVDFGERRLTVADSQVVPDGSAAVVQHDGKPMASVPQWLSKSAHVWVQCPDVEKAWKSLNRHTKDVLAAGGLLTNEQGALLCIHRLGHWDLPKGKVERGEDLPTAAAREVHEECGVPLPIVGAPFAKTFHVYGRKDDKMKVTQWYAMAPSPGSENVQLQPQTEEGITEVRWAMPKEVAKMEPDAFGNIARLMNAWRASQ